MLITEAHIVHYAHDRAVNNVHKHGEETCYTRLQLVSSSIHRKTSNVCLAIKYSINKIKLIQIGLVMLTLQ